MKADDLRLDELVDFTEGALTFRGRELVLHSLHAFAQMRKDLLDTAGLVRHAVPSQGSAIFRGKLTPQPS